MENQLEEIEKLYSKPQEFLIPKAPKEGQIQAKIIIFPLGLDKMSLLNFDEGMPMSEQMKNTKKLIALSLNIDEEKLGELSYEFIAEITEAIMKTNNLEKPKEDKIKKLIEKRKGLMEKKDESNTGTKE